MNNAFEKTAVLPKCNKGSAYSTQINLGTDIQADTKDKINCRL